MTVRGRSVAALAGAAGGFFGGMFGVGGGAVIVPLLTGLLGLSQHAAHGTSLAAIIFTALASAPVYALHGNVDWITGVGVAVAAAVGAPWGARLAARLSTRSLRRVFSVFLLVVAVRLLWAPPAGAASWAEGWTRVTVIAVIGIAAGVFAGFMGVGGGMVAVPAFTVVLDMPQQLAQGTSMVVILGAAFFGARQHARQGTLVAPLVPWLAIGSVLASIAASWWVQGVPPVVLTRAFAAFLIVNAVHGWLRKEGSRPGR